MLIHVLLSFYKYLLIEVTNCKDFITSDKNLYIYSMVFDLYLGTAFFDAVTL